MLNPKLLSTIIAILSIIALSSTQSIANVNSLKADTGAIFQTDKEPGIKSFRLYQNVQTEYGDVTKIKFELKKEAHVMLKIIDVNGNIVEQLVEGDMESGVYNVYFKTTDRLSMKELSYEIEVDNILERIKMTDDK